tara:strand:- start:47 stop:727 length:681 start_codon:yes stop_codon:yes gene_type:complete
MPKLYFDIQEKIDESFKFKLLKPFGPKIGHIKLNDSFIKKMIDLTDNILNDDERENFGKHLAGRIREEPRIPTKLLKEEGVHQLICNFQNQYINSIFPQGMHMGGKYRQVKTDIVSAWIVSQYENEYNPPHWHDSCIISSVMYLKIPELIPRNIPYKEKSDGNIDFINNACTPHAALEDPIKSFAPEVGDMFIFPSRLIHCVHPFLGPGERRSVSVNGFHLIKMDE